MTKLTVDRIFNASTQNENWHYDVVSALCGDKAAQSWAERNGVNLPIQAERPIIQAAMKEYRRRAKDWKHMGQS